MESSTIIEMPIEKTVVRAPIRDRARDAMRAQIAEIALELISENGFENTTADEIAAQAGISRSTFFRYFATKEDVVLSQLEDNGQELAAAVRARPSTEPAWEALRQGFLDVSHRNGRDSGHLERRIKMARVQSQTRSVLAAGVALRLSWRSLLAPEIARRLAVNVHTDPRPMALAAAAIGCLESAVDTWVKSNGTGSLADVLDTAMSALTQPIAAD
jgi:AcrR family transcriptional regulator